MRDRIKALEDPNPVDQVACLVLRVLPELSPYTERALIGCVSGGDPRSQPEQASHPHARELVHSALLKLKALALIEFSVEHIAITDEGKSCLEDLPASALRRGRSAEVRDTKAARQVATDDGEQHGIKGTTKSRRAQSWLSSLTQLTARLWADYVAPLSALATTLRAEDCPRLGRFRQHYLTPVSAMMPWVCKATIGQAWDTSLYRWEHKVAPMIRSGGAILVHVLVQLEKAFSRVREPKPLSEGTGEGKIGARLLKVAGPNGLLPGIKSAGLDHSRSINYAGALLLVCSALSIAGGVLFLSSERANSSRAEEASLSGKRAGSSRVSPIVWLYDRPDRLGRSIFVARRLAGAAWIEGLAIRGENATDQTLTGLQGTIKTD